MLTDVYFVRAELDESSLTLQKEEVIGVQWVSKKEMLEFVKRMEYRTEDLKLTQLFDLESDPWERNNFYDIAGYEAVTEYLRGRMFALRDQWDDESTIFGQQYWQQWRQYDEAVVHGVGKPKGANMAEQIKDWGTDKP